jgi:hypothetical protein
MRVVPLIVVGLLAVSGCSKHHAHHASSAPTKGSSTQTLRTSNGASTLILPRYTPFQPDGSLIAGLSIKSSRQGTCTDTGPAIPGTYVCTTHPGKNKVGWCYPKSGSAELICVASPMAKAAVRIHSTASLPPPVSSRPNAPPTQLLLSDGSVCLSVQDLGKYGKRLTHGILGHDGSLRISYECDGQTSATFGPIDEAKSLWTVKARSTVVQGRLRTRTVKRAWL